MHKVITELYRGLNINENENGNGNGNGNGKRSANGRFKWSIINSSISLFMNYPLSQIYYCIQQNSFVEWT